MIATILAWGNAKVSDVDECLMRSAYQSGNQSSPLKVSSFQPWLVNFEFPIELSDTCALNLINPSEVRQQNCNNIIKENRL